MLRKLLKLCAALGVLGGIVVGILLWNINPLLESLRPKLQTLISEKLHKPITFNKLLFRFFPTLGIELHELTLDASGDTTRTVEGTRVKLVLLETDLLPLFVGDFHIRRFEVDGAELRLVRTETGGLELGGAPLLGNAPKTEAAAEVEPAARKGKVSFAVTDAKLVGSRVSFLDRSVQPPQELLLDNLTADLKDIAPNGVKNFNVSAGVLGGKDNLNVSGSAEMNGALPAGKIRVKAAGLDLTKLSALLLAYKKLPENIALSNQASFMFEADLPAGTFALNLDATATEIAYGNMFRKAAGSPGVLDASGSAGFTGAVKVEKASWRVGDLAFDSPVTVQPGGVTTVALRTTRFPLEGVAALVPAAAVYRPRGNIEATLSAALEGEKSPKVIGSVELAGVGANIPLSADPERPPLELATANGKFDFTEDGLSAKPLSFLLGGQKIDAGLRYTNGADAKLQLAAKSESFELAPLLKSVQDAGPALASSVLKQLQLTAVYSAAKKTAGANLSIESGILSELPLGATKLSLDSQLDSANKPVSATLHPSTIQIFGGSLSLQGGLQPNQNVSVQVRGSGMELAKLMAFTKASEKISVTGTLTNLDIRLSGPSKDFGAHANGTVVAEASKGAIEGFNLLAQTLAKADKIPGLGATLLAFVPEKHRPLLQQNSTPFDRLAVNAGLNGKNIALQSVSLEHSLYSLSGKGEVPASGDLSIDAQLRLSETLTGEMVAKEDKLKLLLDKNRNMVIPVIVRRKDGVFIVLPDFSDLGKRALSNTAKDAAAKALDKVAPGLGGAIDSLFK